MADVISFRQRNASTPRPLRPRDSNRPAEIVIFPGVRYEYHAKPQPEPKPRRLAKRRERLELAE